MLAIPLLTGVLVGSSAQAQAVNHGRPGGKPETKVARGHGARYGHEKRGHYAHYPFGRMTVFLPRGGISIVFGGDRYYYGDGIFYRRKPEGYFVVVPPYGAVVRTIPPGWSRVMIAGEFYYVYNGVYYREVSSGYQVVAAPQSVVVDATAVSSNASSADAESFVVNVPRAQGAYAAVILKRSGQGFIGPQGEFYSEFPKIEQLRVMYAQ